MVGGIAHEASDKSLHGEFMCCRWFCGRNATMLLIDARSEVVRNLPLLVEMPLGYV